MVGNNRIIGPYLFDDNVNSERYLEMINHYALPELYEIFGQRQNGTVKDTWWFQDGAPAHRAIPVHDRLQELFPRRVVALGHLPEWPPRSPDLTPLDYFLWGYVKYRVFLTPPTSLQDLRARVTDVFQQLKGELGRTRMARRPVPHMRARAQQVIDKQGQHIEGRAAP